jgi:hypothetical protein
MIHENFEQVEDVLKVVKMVYGLMGDRDSSREEIQATRGVKCGYRGGVGWVPRGRGRGMESSRG